MAVLLVKLGPVTLYLLFPCVRACVCKVVNLPACLDCVIQSRSGLQSLHLGIASCDGISYHMQVCKKHNGVCDFHHSGNYLFAEMWNIYSLVECVDDARIFGVSRGLIGTQLLVDCTLNFLVPCPVL